MDKLDFKIALDDVIANREMMILQLPGTEIGQIVLMENKSLNDKSIHIMVKDLEWFKGLLKQIGIDLK